VEVADCREAGVESPSAAIPRPAGTRPLPPHPPPTRRRNAWIALAALVIALVIGVVWLKRRSGSGGASTPNFASTPIPALLAAATAALAAHDISLAEEKIAAAEEVAMSDPRVIAARAELEKEKERLPSWIPIFPGTPMKWSNVNRNSETGIIAGGFDLEVDQAQGWESRKAIVDFYRVAAIALGLKVEDSNYGGFRSLPSPDSRQLSANPDLVSQKFVKVEFQALKQKTDSQQATPELDVTSLPKWVPRYRDTRFPDTKAERVVSIRSKKTSITAGSFDFRRDNPQVERAVVSFYNSAMTANGFEISSVGLVGGLAAKDKNGKRELTADANIFTFPRVVEVRFKEVAK